MITIDISCVTFNSAKWIENFFLSLAKQNYSSINYNLFICDNGSRDNTVEICYKLQEKYREQFNSIIISVFENRGFGAGHNLNLHKAKTDYFLVTNVDLEFEQDAIQILVNSLNADSLDIVAWELRQKPYEHPKYYNPVTLETKWNSSACVLYRRSALVEVGGYEERIFMYGEDVELSYRLRDRGYKLKYCPKAVCWHYTYDNPAELKSLQFYGSILSNIYIRLRYGNVRKILGGYRNYLRLFFVRIPVHGHIRHLMKGFATLIKNTPYFLGTRKQSDADFPITEWDYGITRNGAFYKLSKMENIFNPLVSVIIRTCAGRLELLKEAIRSVENQTYSNIELIVVEDGSSFAKKYVESVRKYSSLALVKYFSIEKAGRCLAGNHGLEQATGNFITFLDDDDLLFSDHLEVLTKALILNPLMGAAYSLAFLIRTRFISLSPLVYEEECYSVPYIQKFSRTKLWVSNYLPIQSILFRRELYLKYGGFDPELECLEDWNLWVRYSLADDFLYVDKLTSLYRVPADFAESQKRSITLDSYFSLASQKHNNLPISRLTIGDFKSRY